MSKRADAGDVPNLVLIGFMATGKSTIGRRCARELGYQFRDTDSQVERWAGKSVSRIFADDGEPAFRRLESDAVRVLSGRRGQVIATGGGAPMNAENVRALRRGGVVVLLVADPSVIVARATRRGTRPLLAGAADPGARVAELLATREAAYREAAGAVVDTSGLSPEESAARVVAAYRELATEWSGRADGADCG